MHRSRLGRRSAPRTRAPACAGSPETGSPARAASTSAKPKVRGSSASIAGAKSRTPGESMRCPPRGRSNMRDGRRGVPAFVVAIQLAHRGFGCGISRRTSDDLPTPDWPTSAATASGASFDQRIQSFADTGGTGEGAIAGGGVRRQLGCAARRPWADRVCSAPASPAMDADVAAAT